MAGMSRKICLGMLLGTTALAMATAAHAGGFAIREQSAEFQGMSFAGAAAGGSGLSSMFWNPATITQHRGMKGDYNGSLVMPYARAKDEVGGLGGTSDSGDIGKTAFVPATYSSYQINEMFWVGLAMTAPFGMKTENDLNSRGALYGYKSKIITMNINPVVGVKLNDFISVGAGLQINYMKGDLTNALGGAEIAQVKGDDWGAGFTAGITITPTDMTTIGIGYRSRVKHTLKGTYYNALGGIPLGPASVKHTLPDMLTFSVRQKITDNFTLTGSVEWMNWSLFDKFNIMRGGVLLNPTANTYDWKDSWLFAVGTEYKYSDTLTLRVGYAYEDSPVPDSSRAVRVPDNNRHWLSVGASWAAGDWLTLHAGYSHLFVKDGSVNITTPVPFTATYKNHVNIVAVSATVDTGKLFFGR